MAYVVRVTETDLRRGSCEAVCYGPFSDPQRAREFAWDKLRASVSKAVKARSARPYGIPDQMDLFSVFTQDFVTDESAYRVRSSVEELTPVDRCGKLDGNKQMEML